MSDQKEKQIGQAGVLSLVADYLTAGDMIESSRDGCRILLSDAGYEHMGASVVVLLQRTWEKYPDVSTLMYLGPCQCSQCSMHYSKLTYHTILRAGNGGQVVYSASSNALRDFINMRPKEHTSWSI
jgi:hypothetical protein